MDVQTAFLCVAVVVISALFILCISTFGTKEKSYEEAIAEQRKLPDDLLSNKKDKNKEKKHKNKAGKKVKEKKEEKDEKDDKDEKAEHVQFEETPQILPPEPPVQESNKGNKKKGKLEKIKPILVNKDEPLAIVTELSSSQSPSAEANHFDIIHPKDDLELVRSHSKENLQQLTQSETAANKSPKDTPTRSKKNNKDVVKKKDENAKDEKQETNVQTNASIVTNNKEAAKEIKEQQKETPVKEIKEAVKETASIVQSANKEPKKTKKKNDILAQIEGDAVNVQLLMLFIQKAELSRSEIQILIDHLLNKQMDNPLEHSEWTEGRADPVIKLKKQLAEKEKALTDEHEISMACQNKLKELRAELNGERSRLSANIRQLEETLSAKMTEAQTSHTRMQHILESHAAEKQGFARQIEQLQAKVNEDTAIIHKMQEDQGQTQGHLQQELITQRKQMEVQFAQMRDTENTLKSQLAQRNVEVQELQNELQATCESSSAEMEMLRQQLGLMQGQLMHSEGQLQHYKETTGTLQDVARQLDESRRAQADLDHRLKSVQRHEQELQKQVNSLQAELGLAKNEASETPTLKAELSKVQSELIKLKTELSATMNEAKSEAAEVTALKTALGNKEDELKKSQGELSAVQNDLQQSNAQVTHMESKLNSARKELDTIRIECEKANRDLKEAINDANKYKNEAQKTQDVLTNVQTDLANSHAKIKEINEAASALEALQAENNRLRDYSSRLREKEAGEAQLQITKFQEENDRLRAELTNVMEQQKEQQQRAKDMSANMLTVTKLERPAAEGRENVEDESQKNTLLSSDHAVLHPSTDEKVLLDELKTHLAQKEELIRLNKQIDMLKSDIIERDNVTRQLRDDLEIQKSKNNELRTKNWKVMEALSAAELRAKSSGGKSSEEIMQKIKVEQEEITKALLQRIFPEIKVSEKTHEQWLKVFEHKVCTVLNESKQKSTTLENPDLEKQNKNLQGMISHYKQVIDETESMLNKLQSHVESEETRWQVQLRQKENEVANLRTELKDIQSKVNERTTIFNEANEKLQQKTIELEARLVNAESLTEQTNAELLALRSTQKTVSREEAESHQLATLEKLQEEKTRLSQELQTECNKRATLDAEVTKLRSLVETSETSLAQEKSLVTQLQEEVIQLKSEICGGCSSSEQSMLNGPPTSDSLQSEPPLASRTLITALEYREYFKNTEFANNSITKPVNLVQSEQEIENSPLTTKYSSKSCHMPDHNTEASRKPLIGQQHKKNKKRRKGGSGKK
ncbi:PREDICTED: kinectin isoform X3 [Dinoponera quadriceps]|nr:PREDICTED: kinectin isoform X3 [Dinoponera quadriceps]XP_014480151.1 PREDICTED: kinectin isoform X3 [Dinoponera quadriceps]